MLSAIENYHRISGRTGTRIGYSLAGAASPPPQLAGIFSESARRRAAANIMAWGALGPLSNGAERGHPLRRRHDDLRLPSGRRPARGPGARFTTWFQTETQGLGGRIAIRTLLAGSVVIGAMLGGASDETAAACGTSPSAGAFEDDSSTRRRHPRRQEDLVEGDAAQFAEKIGKVKSILPRLIQLRFERASRWPLRGHSACATTPCLMDRKN